MSSDYPPEHEHEGLRVQPHSIEAEEGAIAAMLLSGDCLDEAISTGCKPEWFFKSSHQVIFSAVVEIQGLGTPVDEVSLLEHLKKTGLEDEVGGVAAIYAIQERIQTPTHFRYHIGIVREKYELRRIIKTSRMAIEEAYDNEDPVSITARLSKLADATADGAMLEVKPASVTADQAIERIKRELSGEKVEGIRFGLKDLDDMLFGLKPAEMTVLAARPGMGKTSIIQLLNESCEQDGEKPLIFSLEMTGEQYDYRYLCMKARVDSRRIREGVISSKDQQDIAKAYKETKDSQRFIVDGYLDIHQIRATCRRAKQKYGITIIIVDYLQLVKRDPRVKGEEAVAEISRGLKQIGKELNIPVLALAQLNRDCERDNRRPRKSDLRESGSIEQDADNIIMLHASGSDKHATALEVEAIIEKNRYGPEGVVKLMFNRQFTRYELAARESETQHAQSEPRRDDYDPKAMRRQYGG